MGKELKKVEKYCDEAELYWYEGDSRLARSSLNKIETCKSSHGMGVGIRVSVKGAIGFSFLNDLSQLDAAAKTAAKTAKLSSREKYHFPSKQKYTRISAYDPRIKSASEDDLVDSLLKIMSGMKRHASPNQAEVSASHSTIRIENSNGVEVKEHSSVFSAYATAQKKESTSQEYVLSRDYDNDLKHLGVDAGYWAKKSVGGKPMNFSGDIIMGINPFMSFLASTVLRAVDGEKARRKKSIWHNKTGKRVASEHFSLWDDPLLGKMIGSFMFDDEGTACKNKPIIHDGVLKTFLYDSRTANLSKTKSTGNGFRDSFAGVPRVASTNIVVDPSERTDVFDCNKAIFVRDLMGFHNMNEVTGDFSLDINQGFKVAKGELKSPVRGCMLTGNFFDILQNLEFDKKDTTQGWFHGPKIRFKGRVVGK